MYIVHVHIHVLPESIESFRRATLHNATNSIREDGVARFDIMQQADDSTRFVLVEVYRTEQDAALHKETEHYKLWRDTVASMMAAPRQSVKYANVFPEDRDW